MEAGTVRRESVRSQSRHEQLLEIMKDAVVHVLERQDNRRGPYVIHDNDLKINAKQSQR